MFGRAIYVTASHMEFIYNTYVVCHLRILVRASPAYLRSGTYIFPVQIETAYVIASYLSLFYCVTYLLVVPTYFSVRG